MVYPLLPLYLSTTLGAPTLALGIIEGVAEALVSILKGWSGFHSDRLRRRTPYIRAGYTLAAISKPMLAFSAGWLGVLMARSLDRIGKGLRTTARDALITDVVSPIDRGRAFGLHRSMDTTGALVGVMLAGALLWVWPGQYTTVFLYAGIFGFIAVVLTFFVRDVRPALETSGDSAVPSAAEKQPFPRRYWYTLGLFAIFSFANSSDAFLLLRVHQNGFSDVGTLVVYAGYNIANILCAYPAGYLSDHFPRWRIIRMGWLLYGIVYAGFALTTGAWTPVLFIVYGICMGLTQGVSKAIIADLAPADRRGAALGLFHFSSGIAVLPGSALAGWLWDRFGPEYAFWLGSLVAFAAMILAGSVSAPAQRAEHSRK